MDAVKYSYRAEFSQYVSPVDGTVVVYIDTPDIPEDKDGPVIRVYLNDDPIFENPVFPSRLEVERQPNVS